MPAPLSAGLRKRTASPVPGQCLVNRRPVISPPGAPSRVRRHQRLGPRPFLIAKIMTIMHGKPIDTNSDLSSRLHAQAV